MHRDFASSSVLSRGYVTAEHKFARIVKSKVYEQKIRTNCKGKKKIKRNYMISFLAGSFGDLEIFHVILAEIAFFFYVARIFAWVKFRKIVRDLTTTDLVR